HRIAQGAVSVLEAISATKGLSTKIPDRRLAWRKAGRYRHLIELGRQVTPFLVDDVVAALDVQSFAGNEPCCVMSKERRRNTNIVDTHKTARRRLRLGLFKQRVKFGNA